MHPAELENHLTKLKGAASMQEAITDRAIWQESPASCTWTTVGYGSMDFMTNLPFSALGAQKYGPMFIVECISGSERTQGRRTKICHEVHRNMSHSCPSIGEGRFLPFVLSARLSGLTKGTRIHVVSDIFR